MIDETGNLYHRWKEMWNGNLDLAEQLIAADCVVYQAPFGPGPPAEFRGPEGIRQMITMGRATFSDISFAIEVGPVASADLLAARWISHATYRGGIPGATVPPGTTITYRGADMFRLKGGKIAEYWVSADVYHFMAQLGAVGESD